jgi:hypothetical protein
MAASANNQYLISKYPSCFWRDIDRTCGEGIQKHLVDVHDGRPQTLSLVPCFCEVLKGLDEELSCNFWMERMSSQGETVVGKNGECRAFECVFLVEVLIF